MEQPAVIVTGASRGLGAAIARAAAKLGASVVVTARSAAGVTEVVDSIPGALGVTGDITQEETIRRIVEQTVERFGRIDAVVNNAGTEKPFNTVADADFAAWEATLKLNVLAPVMLASAALPYLRESKGRVINVSSGAAVSPIFGTGAYSISKAALNQFNSLLSKEEPDVIAIAVRPGMVDTPMQAEIRAKGEVSMDEATYNRFVNAHTQGRLLPPELPGRATAVMALHAPAGWSGEFINWDDERVQALSEQHDG